MNRESRRAQMVKLSKKFRGFNITDGRIDIPIRGTEDSIVVNVNDYSLISGFTDILDRFQNIEDYYSAEQQEVDAEEDEVRKTVLLSRMFKKVVSDFRDSVDEMLGVGATERIFGAKLPMPTAMFEFLEDMSEIIDLATTLQGQSEATPVMNKGTKYSADRGGDA